MAGLLLKGLHSNLGLPTPLLMDNGFNQGKVRAGKRMIFDRSVRWNIVVLQFW
jgi:hypothetical protein